MIRTKSLTIVTPLGDVEIISKPVDGSEMSKEDFNDAMSELGEVFSGKVSWFKIPSQNDTLFIFGKEVLVNSIVKVETEVIEECQDEQVSQ